jgi:hypothetical protein
MSLVVLWVELCDGGSASRSDSRSRYVPGRDAAGHRTVDPQDLMPINPDWILEGAPRARAKVPATTVRLRQLPKADDVYREHPPIIWKHSQCTQ